MSEIANAPVTGPFFLRVGDDFRFCFFHAPRLKPGQPPRGSVLAVHAFAEEINKTRAAAADGARALAAAGFAVLQIDLAGCGDSEGDFADATWAGWLADLAAAWSWLQRHACGSRWLWGTRLGAPLADHFGRHAMPSVDGLVLWQPVVNGAQHLGQFLRLKTVGSLLRATASATASSDDGVTPTSPATRVADATPRTELASGRSVEVAGYMLTPDLADAIESARLGVQDGGEGWIPPRVRWFDVSSQATATATVAPIAARVIDRWRAGGGDIVVETVFGPAFWQTQEIARCDSLVAATVAALVQATTST